MCSKGGAAPRQGVTLFPLPHRGPAGAAERAGRSVREPEGGLSLPAPPPIHLPCNTAHVCTSWSSLILPPRCPWGLPAQEGLAPSPDWLVREVGQLSQGQADASPSPAPCRASSGHRAASPPPPRAWSRPTRKHCVSRPLPGRTLPRLHSAKPQRHSQVGRLPPRTHQHGAPVPGQRPDLIQGMALSPKLCEAISKL